MGNGCRAITGGVVGLVAWLAAGSAARATDAKVVLVELKGSDTVRLDATKASDSLALHLRVSPNVDLTGVRFVQASLEGENHGTWSSAFTPTFGQELGAPAGRPETLIVTVDLEKAHRPGTYVVTLEVSGKTRAAPPVSATAREGAKARNKASSVVQDGPLEAQTIELKLIHPEALLKVDGPIIVERIIRFPGLCTVVRKTPLVVRETGGASRVTNLVFTQERDAQRKDRPEGRLVPMSKWPATVAAQSTADAEFAAHGDFSMGTAQGTIEISGDQVKAPVTVNYEVRSRLSHLWVFLLIGLGLGTGFVLRTYAPRVIATNQTVLDAATLMFELDPYRNDPDDELKNTANDLAAQVSAVLDDRAKNDDVAAQLAIARTALAAAVQARNERARDVDATLQSLKELFDPSVILPNPFAAALASRRNDLARAREAFDDKNFAAAQKIVQSTTEGLMTDVRPKVAPWAKTLEDALVKLHSYQSDLPAAAASELAGITDARQTLARVANLRDPDPIDVLYQVAQAQSAGSNLFGQITDIVRDEAAGVWTALRAVDGGTISAEIEELRHTLLELDTSYAALPEIGALPETLRAVSVAARKALMTIADPSDRWNGKEDQRKAIVAKIAALQLRSAAEDVKRELNVVAGRKVMTLADPGLEGLVQGPQRFVVQRVVAKTRPSHRAPAGRGLGPTEKQRNHAANRIRLVKKGQYILAAGVILLVGAMTLGETFVGTPVEILGLFFWGFGTDVSVATATELTHKKS